MNECSLYENMSHKILSGTMLLQFTSLDLSSEHVGIGDKKHTINICLGNSFYNNITELIHTAVKHVIFNDFRRCNLQIFSVHIHTDMHLYFIMAPLS